MAQARPSPIPFTRPHHHHTTRVSLPLPPTSIVGRDGEVRQVLAALDRDDVRLVTLLGPGGVGKTRLALEVAHRIAPDFADGAVFVPVETLRDPDGLPAAVARALGLQDDAGLPIEEQLDERLDRRHLLLVLDNVEHVLAAAPWVASTLMAHPRLAVLATSRAPLHLGGEWLIRIPPLPATAPDAAAAAAVALFVDRARAVLPDFSPDADELDTIAEVCDRLDGLPLAIELAAARVPVLPPAAMLARLTSRLTLLTGARRDVPVRLSSMRDAIGWSYDLLDADEQQAFRRLAVFLGGFTVDGLAFVVGWPDAPLDEVEAIARLQSLVDQSLVQRDPGVESRFRMLETVREYGLQQAVAVGQTDDDQHAHAAYVIDLARRAEPALISPELPRWLDRLDSEYPTILAALDWLEAHDRLEDAINTLNRISYFLAARGHFTDTRARVERWLTHPAIAARGHARGVVLKQWGSLLGNAGDPPGARAAFAEAVELLEAAGDRWYEAQARTMLAGVCGELGDHQSARQLLPAALEAARAADNHRLVSINLNNLAGLAETDGDPERAAALRAEAAAVAQERGDLWAQAFHLSHLAARACEAGDLEEAERLGQEQRGILESYRSQRELPRAWELLAWIALARGDLDAAADRAATGLAIAERSGIAAQLTAANVTVGVSATERGEIVAAGQALSAALRGLDPARQPADVAQALEAWAWLAASIDDTDRAARFHGAAVRALRDGGFADAADDDAYIFRPRSLLRERLGAAWLARSESAGATVPVDEVMAEALAWTPVGDEPAADADAFDLSPRELEVLRLLAAGMTNREMAEELFVSRRTVATHLEHIFLKLDARTRTAAVAIAIRHGLA